MSNKPIPAGAMNLSREQEKALRDFAAKYGRNWKSKLNYKWMSGHDYREEGGCYLRQVRNQFGPSWLVRYKLPEAQEVTR
jgi:hypothetical protein